MAVTRRNVQIPEIIIEDVKILGGSYRNFAGRPDKYNRNGGKKYFNIILDDIQAENLMKEGWRVKEMKKRDEQEPTRYFMQINLSWTNEYRIPDIQMKKGKVITQLDDDTVKILDGADIKSAYLRINPYPWYNDQDGTEGITAWVKKLYITIDTNEFESSFFDEPEGEQQAYQELPF